MKQRTLGVQMEINTLAFCGTDAGILLRVAYGPLATWINSLAISWQKKIPYDFLSKSAILYSGLSL